MRLKVLLIEDDQVLSRTIALVLSDRYEILLAERLQDGIVRAETDAPDVILLDLGLPCASVERVVFSISYLSKIAPVVVLTGRGDELIAVQAMNRGASSFCHKPVGIDGLTAEIEKVHLSRKAKEQQRQTVEDIEEVKAQLRTMINADNGH